MSEMNAAEVLIVGAGPTGLSLAITLRRHGIAVRIIDRAAQPTNVSKALALWSASLEALQGMGVVDHFVREGRRLNALCVGEGDRRLATLAVGEGIDSAFPFPLLLPQSRTEALLAARLAELGCAIERNVELVNLAQDGSGVTATLRHADGRSETVTTRYLAGCDGARSAVRQALDIAFEGYTEPQTFLLADVKIDGGDLDHRSIYLWWHNGGTIAMFPFGEEVWRVFAMRGADSPKGEEPATLDEVQHCVDHYGPHGLKLRDPSWLSIFRINERLAAHYRVGRCFIAGDAAHIHSPAGGQGMNTGIQDAVNLGWKLAYALKGVGNRELLLESYQAERRPIARRDRCRDAKAASIVRRQQAHQPGAQHGGVDPGQHSRRAPQAAGRAVGDRVRLPRRAAGCAGRRQARRQAHGGRYTGARSLDRRCRDRQGSEPMAPSLRTASLPAAVPGREAAARPQWRRRRCRRSPASSVPRRPP